MPTMSTTSRPLRPLHVAALLVGASAFAFATASNAQTRSRVSVRAELGASTFISAPQSSDYGFGFAGRGDLSVGLFGPVLLHAFGSYSRWPASASATQSGFGASGASTVFGGGLGLEPRVASRVWLRAEADLGLSLNGQNSDTRLAWNVGVGAWFGVASAFDLGAMVRVGGISAAANESSNVGGHGGRHRRH